MLLIFDCDGVVIDSMNIHNEVESAFYHSRLGIAIRPEELSRRFAGVPQSAILEELSQETGRALPDDLKGFIQDLDAAKADAFTERLRPIPGMTEAIDALEDMPRCIASGASVAQLDLTLDITGLYSRFAPNIFSSDMVSRGKPFPDLFLYAAEKHGYPPAGCLVIEDGVAGVQAAVAAGMSAFGFIGGSHCNPAHGDWLREAGAQLIFGDMKQLPGMVRSHTSQQPAFSSRLHAPSR